MCKIERLYHLGRSLVLDMNHWVWDVSNVFTHDAMTVLDITDEDDANFLSALRVKSRPLDGPVIFTLDGIRKRHSIAYATALTAANDVVVIFWRKSEPLHNGYRKVFLLTAAAPGEHGDTITIKKGDDATYMEAAFKDDLPAFDWEFIDCIANIRFEG